MSSAGVPEVQVPQSGEVTPIIELSVTSEGLLDRLPSYLPSPELLAEYDGPKSLDVKRRAAFRKKYPGCDYAALHHEGKMLIVPAWHPLNTVPPIHHGADYGSGVFEGGSAEPVVRNGKLVGANIILLKDKMRRMFGKSLPSREFKLEKSPSDFTQVLIDLVAAHGSRLYMGPKGIKRAYIRPVARPAHDNGLGVGVPEGASADAVIEPFYWPSYVDDPETVYHGTGAIAEALPAQRLQPIEGKDSSNYGPSGPLTKKAKKLGGTEALLFAPFTSRNGERGETVLLDQDYKRKGRDVMEIMPDLSLADGPGEEIAVVNEDLKQLWVLPMDVNRLGGTTLEHVRNYIAPQLDLTVVERTFSLNERRAAQNMGHKVAPIFVGNAIRICPIGQINMRDEKSNLKGSLEFEIPDTVRRMQEIYEAQVSGQVDSGNPELLTPINLADGNAARRQLDALYADWFEPEYLAETQRLMAA